MRDVIYVKLDIVYSINQQLNETISRKSYFFETVKSKVIISLFETVRLSVSISPRNLYNSLKSIKDTYCILITAYINMSHCRDPVLHKMSIRKLNGYMFTLKNIVNEK